MQKRIIHILLVVCCTLVLTSLDAQMDIVLDNDQVYDFPSDSTSIRSVSFDEVKLKELRESSRYNYDLNPDYEDDFLKRVFTKIFNWLEDIWPEQEEADAWSFSGKVFSVLLAMGLLIFALAKSKLTWIFNKKEKESEIELDEIDIQLDDDQLQKSLDNAVAKGQYRLAIRYEFIILLKSLEASEIIAWKKAKTNYEYIDEIDDAVTRNTFRQAVSVYEHVWYGDFSIENESKYRSLSQIFKSINTEEV